MEKTTAFLESFSQRLANPFRVANRADFMCTLHYIICATEAKHEVIHLTLQLGNLLLLHRGGGRGEGEEGRVR